MKLISISVLNYDRKFIIFNNTLEAINFLNTKEFISYAEADFVENPKNLHIRRAKTFYVTGKTNNHFDILFNKEIISLQDFFTKYKEHESEIEANFLIAIGTIMLGSGITKDKALYENDLHSLIVKQLNAEASLYLEYYLKEKRNESPNSVASVFEGDESEESEEDESEEERPPKRPTKGSARPAKRGY